MLLQGLHVRVCAAPKWWARPARERRGGDLHARTPTGGHKWLESAASASILFIRPALGNGAHIIAVLVLEKSCVADYTWNEY